MRINCFHTHPGCSCVCYMAEGWNNVNLFYSQTDMIVPEET